MRAKTVGLLAIAACGVAVWLAASASGSGRANGGTLRVNISKSDVTTLDPQIDYEFLGGSILWITCVKLVYYPDRPAPLGSQIRPEAAAGLPRVSANGRTYTFTVRSGYRFNTGEPLTAASFGRAFERIFAPKMGSPGVNFVSDIVGAGAALKGKRALPTGIKVSGNKLSISLVKPAPDLVARLAMNFFCAVPVNTPIDSNGVTPAMAGPYYIAQRVPDRLIVLKANPNYHGPRPHHLAEIDFTPNTNQQTSFLQIDKNQADYDLYGTPSTEMASLAKRFGVNRSRFWVHPAMTVNYLAMNTKRAPFTDPKLRQAVNFAVSRSAVLAQAGFKAGTERPGAAADDARVPQREDLSAREPRHRPREGAHRRQELHGESLHDDRRHRFAPGTGDPGRARPDGDHREHQAVRLRRARQQDGRDERAVRHGRARLDRRLRRPVRLHQHPALRRQDHEDEQRQPRAVRRSELQQAHAAGVAAHGSTRFSAYGKLDVDINRVAAPWASLSNSNTREFVSSKVGCYIFQPILGAMDLTNTCLK